MSLTPEQQAAAYAPCSVVITAGAGTGKTHMLAERYLYYLQRNLSPLEVVAVTFTEKAATELRSRIRALVSQKLPERLDLLAELEAAQISTIHALSARICQEHWQEIDIPADFEVLESLEGQIWLEDGLKTALANLPPEIFSIVPYSLLQQVLNKLLEDPYTATKALDLGVGDWHELIANARTEAVKTIVNDAVWQSSYAILEQHQGEAGDKLEAIRTSVLEAMADLEDAEDIDRAIATIDKVNLRVGSKKNWQSDGLKTVRAALKALRENVRRVTSQGLLDLKLDEADQRLKQIIPVLTQAYRQVTNYLSRLKLQSKVLTFSDLEIYALQALNRTLVQKYYQQRWQVFLVDEFQDTNPTQAELLSTLTSQAELTIVGDVKQSIYGFRRADIRVFQQFRDRILTSGGKEVVLSTSFRTHQALIDRLNRVFAPLLAENHQDLAAFRKSTPIGGEGGEDFNYLQVLTIGNPSTPEGEEKPPKPSKAQRQRVEAFNLAEKIEQMLENKTLVFDKETRQTRPIQPKDIAILTRTWQPLEIYSEALSAMGIPVAPGRGGNLLATREAKDGNVLLRFLANPKDDIALVAVLRSPFFAISDRLLFQLRQAFDKPQTEEKEQIAIQTYIGKLDCLIASGITKHFNLTYYLLLITYYLRTVKFAIDRRLTDCDRCWWEAIQDLSFPQLEQPIKVLKQLLVASKSQTPSRILQISDRLTGYTAVIANLAGSQRRLADWQGFISLVKDLERGTYDLFTVVRRLKNIYENEIAVPRPILTANNAVSLMTIFASKGLEWGLVIVADLSKERPKNFPAVYFDPQLGVAVKSKNSLGEIQKPVLYSWLEYLQDCKERAEAYRVLYVALTRARDYLWLSAAEPYKGELNRLQKGLTAAGVPTFTIPYTDAKALPPIPQTPAIPQKLPLLLNPVGSGLSELPVTALTDYAKCPQRFKLHFIDGHPGLGEGLASSMQVGTLVHKALENNITQPQDLLPFAEGEWSKAVFIDAIALARRFFQLPLYKHFRQTAIAKERQVSLKLGNITFNGVIDLVGDNWILDYKSDRTMQPLEHRFQLWAYARALQYDNAHIAYLRHDFVHSFNKSELKAIAPEAENLTKNIYRGNYTATPTMEKCSVCPYIAFCNDAMI